MLHINFKYFIDDWFYGYCGPLAVTPRRTLYLLSLKLKGVATRKSWLISPVLKGVATRKSRLIPPAMPKSFLIPLKNIIPELLFVVPCFPKTNPSCWACSEVGIWWFRSLDTAAVGLSGESATRLKGTEGHIVWRNSCPISGTLGFLSSSFSKISGQTIPRVTSTSLMNIPRRIMSSQMRMRRVAQNILSSSWGGKMVIRMFWWCLRLKYLPVNIFTIIRTTSSVWKIRHRPRPLNLSLEPTFLWGSGHLYDWSTRWFLLYHHAATSASLVSP